MADAAEAVLDRLAAVHTELVGELPYDVEDETVQHVKTVLVANKTDADGRGRPAGGRPRVVRAAVPDPADLGATRERVWTPCVAPRTIYWECMRVYTKVPGKPVDRTKPFTVPIGSTVLDLAREIHRDFEHSLKFAKVWGTGVFEGQTVKRDHELHDADVVELHV